MKICWENVNRDLATLIAFGKYDGGYSDCQIKVDKERLYKLKGYVEGVIDYINWLNDYPDDDTDEHDTIRERIESMLDRLNEEQGETEVTIEKISETTIDDIIEKLEMAKRGEVEITKLAFEGRVIDE